MTHDATTPPLSLSYSSGAAIIGFMVYIDESYVSADATCTERSWLEILF